MSGYKKEVLKNIKRTVNKLKRLEPLQHRSVLDLAAHLETLVQQLEDEYE